MFSFFRFTLILPFLVVHGVYLRASTNQLKMNRLPSLNIEIMMMIIRMIIEKRSSDKCRFRGVRVMLSKLSNFM